MNKDELQLSPKEFEDFDKYLHMIPPGGNEIEHWENYTKHLKFRLTQRMKELHHIYCNVKIPDEVLLEAERICTRYENAYHKL